MNFNNITQARTSLAKASGKPEEAQVKLAVRKKFPQIKPGGAKGAIEAKKLV